MFGADVDEDAVGDSASATGGGDAGDDGAVDDNASASSSAVAPKKPRHTEPWFGEAWAQVDGLVLNLPIFKGCSLEFKRLLLRAIREYEYHDVGKETWYDADYDEICTLEHLAADRLPPLKHDFMGQRVDAEEYICKGGDYDTKLVVVISGTVEKLVGDAPQGGVCIVRTLQKGDYEGVTEFLGVGSEQRTCALRGGPDGAHIRYITRQAVTDLLKQQVIDERVEQPEDETDPRIMRAKWLQEVAYFAELSLDRIDSLNHKSSRDLLMWSPGPVGAPDTPMDLLHVRGQRIFALDNALGTSVSGPLPEGIEERYYFDGQTVLKPGVAGDCCILILRGQVEAVVPEGCAGQCLPRMFEPDNPDSTESWLGEGRDCNTGYAPIVLDNPTRSRANSSATDNDGEEVLDEDGFPMTPTESPRAKPRVEPSRSQLLELLEKPKREISMVGLVNPENYRRAQAHLRKAGESGRIELSHMATSDWRWSWDDRACLEVFDVLEHAKLLTPMGMEIAEEVRDYLNPPPEEPPPEPQAVLSPGTQIGRLALLNIPIVFSGVVRARGPVLVAVLHRSVLLAALEGCPELELFMPKGLSRAERVEALKHMPSTKNKEYHLERPSHLSPVTGPPSHQEKEQNHEPLAGTAGAFNSPTGLYKGVPGADAFEHVLLSAIKSYSLIWDLVCDAPPRLLDDLVRAWEPRWLLPGEVIVVDEEPDADFLFVLVHGTCVVTLESREIDHIGQGSVQGAAQLLSLNGWTRTVTVDPRCNGEAMIQVLIRSKLVQMLDGHPLPKGRLRAVEESLSMGKQADWRILKNIPAFGSCAQKPFLSRLHKDADIRLFCAGDTITTAGDTAAAMIVVLAGTLRCEQPKTLFYVQLNSGEWSYQDNILGNCDAFGYDTVAVTNVMVLVLYRHAMQNAMVDHPETRKFILHNETWRSEANCPEITVLPVFAKLPTAVTSDLMEECRHVYYRPGSVIVAPGEIIEDDALCFILRGEMSISVMGIETRTISAGACVGLHRFMGLDCPKGQITVRSTTACDCVFLQRSTIQKALEDELLEDDMLPYTGAFSVLAGGEILDAFGFPIGDGSAKNMPDCVEQSEVFSACSETFVEQIPLLVEDRAFWPGETVYRQYDKGDFMYFIRAGRCRLEVLGRKEHEIVDAGSTLGEMAVLDQVPHYAETAVAETHIWVRALHKKLLLRSLSSFPEEEKSLRGQARGGGGGTFG
eukprot:TRINITY_DN56754_c0_g1_i1.p1 TRINITY_DN56754_c0_g1~~TRINITY_DN56754_c0_g1_i1.p1  ORF type:complete len:1214 (+),score=226.14 TRINITY_DN56754_c0_g1_i1:42-3683(+)